MKLRAAFSLALLSGSASAADCCTDPLVARPGDLTYRKLSSAGVQIPVHNFRIISSTQAEFEIRVKEINRVQFAFAATAGFYRPGMSAEDKDCPYIEFPGGFVTQQRGPNDTISVTMTLSPALLQHIEKQGCLVTLRPDP